MRLLEQFFCYHEQKANVWKAKIKAQFWSQKTEK